MDTSSQCQTYHGRAQTIEAIDPSHQMASRGIQFTMFEALATSTSNDCALPLIDTIPSGSRVIVANHPDSVIDLLVVNGAFVEDDQQDFTLSPGQLAEVYLVGPSTDRDASVPHFGVGMPASWTDFGWWWWDISSFDLFPEFG